MAYRDSDMFSSPDPLNDSGIQTSPEKTRRRASKSRHRVSLPMNSSSPHKQTFELAVGNGISPQKLFVTVEAANSDSDDRLPWSARRETVFPSPYRSDVSPTRLREHTTTTTIPLRGLSDTEDADLYTPARAATPKKGRGRPRKSATPIPKKSDNRRRTVDFEDDDDDDIWDLGNVGGKGKGRSRSRSTTKKGPAKKAKATPKLPQGNATDGITPKKGRGRPRKVRQDETTTLTHENLGQNEPSHIAADGPNENDLDTRDFGAMGTNTTIGDDDEYQEHPDVVLARFDDNMPTPREKGWSSPHVVSTGGGSSTSKRRLLSTRGGEAQNNNETDLQQDGADDFDEAMDYSSDEGAHDFGVQSADSDSEEANGPAPDDGDVLEEGDDYGSEADDNVGDMREFDTIMESEDFSMISVDSLREHLSPANEDENATPAPKSLGAILQPARGGNAEDSFSTIAQSVLDAASPLKTQPPLRPFRGQHLTQPDDSFSSIAQSILDAASPIKGSASTSVVQSGPSQTRRQSPNLPEPETSQSNSSPKNLTVSQSAVEMGGDETVGQSRLERGNIAALDTDMTNSAPVIPNETSPRPSSRRSSHWSGLATPRESTSPILPAAELNTNVSAHGGMEEAFGEADRNDEIEDQDTHMDSSPPTYVKPSPPQALPQEQREAPQETLRHSYTLRQQRVTNSETVETPSIVFSSPALPPLNQQPVPAKNGNLAPNPGSSSSQRPPLSPITRAGQVLQDVVVAPSSPRARSQSLGSPFTSPFKGRGGSGTPAAEIDGARGQSQPINTRRLSNFNLFTSRSDGNRPQSHDSPAHGSKVTKNQRPSSAWSAIDPRDDPFQSDAQSQRPSLLVEKSQYTLGLPKAGLVAYPKLGSSRVSGGGSEIPKPRQTTTNVSFTSSHPTIDHNVEMTDAPPLSSTGKESARKREKAPETHAQRLEREYALERQAVSQQIEAASTSQVIILSSEKDEDMESPDEQEGDGDDDLDIWQDQARHSSSIIEDKNVKQPSSDSRQASKKQVTMEKPRRGKIPSPWRKNSRRLVYSDELADMSPAVSRNRTPSPERSQKSAGKQISNEKPVAQESSKLDGESQEFTGIWQMQMPQIPQKANFNPKPRSNLSQMDFSALEPSPRKSLPTPVTSDPAGPSKDPASHRKVPRYSSPSPLVITTVNRLNVSPPKALQSSPFANTDNVMHDRDNFLSPDNENFGSDADWPVDMSTPARSTISSKAASSQSKSPPKKPSSPLKSIIKQSKGKSTSTISEPPKSTSQSLPKSKPVTEPKPQPLSTTVWSKVHWRILNKILQEAKPLDAREVYSLGDLFVKETFFVGFEVERNEEGFAKSKLLGKEVFVKDSSMVLEQWHLEIMAVFREIVGWKDEREVATRLFGLVEAEERRLRRAREEMAVK